MELEEALQTSKGLQDQLKKFEGIDPEQATRDRQSISDQLANTQRQFNEYKQQTTQQIAELTADYQSKLNQKDVAFNFTNSLSSAGVLPEYRDRFGDVANSLKFENGKLLSQDGAEFDAASLREKYPAMFAAIGDGAGSGSSGSNPPPAPPGTRTVKPENGVISGVNPADLVSGKVQIAS